MMLVDFQNQCKGNSIERLVGKLIRNLPSPHLDCICPDCTVPQSSKLEISIGWDTALREMKETSLAAMRSVWDDANQSVRIDLA